MTLDDFIDNMCNTSISNLFIGIEGQVELHPTRRKKLIAHMNMGLRLIHSKFALRRKELIIIARENISLYRLSKEHSMQCGTSALKYIEDTLCDPFEGDLIRVLEVWNEIGMQFSLNEKGVFGSVRVPVYDTIQLTHPQEGQAYSVIYQAASPVMNDTDDGCKEFQLPPILYEALESYVAAKLFKDIGGEGNSVRAQENMAIYEARMMDLELNDLGSTSQIEENTKGDRYGFS